MSITDNRHHQTLTFSSNMCVLIFLFYFILCRLLIIEEHKPRSKPNRIPVSATSEMSTLHCIPLSSLSSGSSAGGLTEDQTLGGVAPAAASRTFWQTRRPYGRSRRPRSTRLSRCPTTRNPCPHSHGRRNLRFLSVVNARESWCS